MKNILKNIMMMTSLILKIMEKMRKKNRYTSVELVSRKNVNSNCPCDICNIICIMLDSGFEVAQGNFHFAGAVKILRVECWYTRKCCLCICLILDGKIPCPFLLRC